MQTKKSRPSISLSEEAMHRLVLLMQQPIYTRAPQVIEQLIFEAEERPGLDSLRAGKITLRCVTQEVTVQPSAFAETSPTEGRSGH